MDLLFTLWLSLKYDGMLHQRVVSATCYIQMGFTTGRFGSNHWCSASHLLRYNLRCTIFAHMYVTGLKMSEHFHGGITYSSFKSRIRLIRLLITLQSTDGSILAASVYRWHMFVSSTNVRLNFLKLKFPKLYKNMGDVQELNFSCFLTDIKPSKLFLKKVSIILSCFSLWKDAYMSYDLYLLVCISSLI